jgi:hypothetical protein
MVIENSKQCDPLFQVWRYKLASHSFIILKKQTLPKHMQFVFPNDRSYGKLDTYSQLNTNHKLSISGTILIKKAFLNAKK